jgi:hypothetical protein
VRPPVSVSLRFTGSDDIHPSACPPAKRGTRAESQVLQGDWRAAEALMSRIYGKPEETVRQVEVNPATAVLKSMSLEEKLELLHSLRRGDPIALPVVESVPPTA